MTTPALSIREIRERASKAFQAEKLALASKAPKPVAKPSTQSHRQGMPSQGYEPSADEGFWNDDTRRSTRNQDVYGGAE